MNLSMNHLYATYAFNKSMDNTDNGTAFAARPLKHWRKQYQSNLGFSRAASGMPMDRPGGLTSVPLVKNQCQTCNGALNANVDVFNDSPCASCSPIASKVKPLPDTAYTNNSAYLQSRCSTYEQKLGIEHTPRNSYFSPEGRPLEPSASPSGAQVRETTNCYSHKPPLVCNTTIYKPNNTPYAQQGGVSASSRLSRLKYNTLNSNGAEYNSAVGAMGVNSGRYQTEASPSYYTKYKPQPVAFPHKNGRKSYCSPPNTMCMSEVI